MIVLVAGPSGAGKSTIIRALLSKNSVYRHVPVAVTRPIRDDEIGKFHIDKREVESFISDHDVIFRNELYGVTYLTIGDDLSDWIESGLIPIIDWPVDKVDVFRQRFGSKVVVIYIRPEALEDLDKRLEHRSGREVRFDAGSRELAQVDAGLYKNYIDKIFINITDGASELADTVEKWIHNYLQLEDGHAK